MSLPQESPVFTTGAVYVEDRQPGFWSSLAGGIGHVISSAAHLASEALPYVAKAASMYASTYAALPSSPNYIMEMANDFDMSDYPSRTVRFSQPHANPLRTLPDYTPSRIVQDALAQIQRSTQQPAQNMSQWHNQTTRILNELARTKGLPSYEEFHRQNGIVPSIQPDQSGMDVARFVNPGSSSPSNGLIPEDAYPIQGAQQPRSYADLYQNQGSQSTQPDDALSALQRLANRRPALPATPIQSATVNDLLQQTFADPTGRKPNIFQQAGSGRLTDNRLHQVELNLDNMQARGQMTPAQRAPLEMAAKALFANNWLHHDGQENSDDTVTYRGMTVNKEMAPVLAYADAEQTLNKDTRLSPQQDWMKQVEQTASGFIKGVANGIVAGAGPKAAAGEEGAYMVGDILGAVGINSAALLTGVFAPAVWAGYGLAREANREVDAGKPLNPAAIAASGAISAIPGTAAVKVPLGTLGRIGTGLATGYASDIANRGVQQLGDTGRINPKTLDYRPGLGTITGGTVGLLSHPVVSQAFQKYLLGRQAQILAGEKVPVSYEDFVVQFKQEYNLTDADIAYYENRSNILPANHPFNRPIWSEGPQNNPLLNAYNHSIKPNHPEAYGVQPGDIRYLQQTHQLLDNIPERTELVETKAGMKRYYSPNAGPDGQTIFTVEDASGAPRSSYTPDGTPQEQYEYFRSRGGKYKGKIK